MNENEKKETEQNEPNSEQNEEQAASQALAQCKDECGQWKDKFLRLNADFQNYKKRQEKERAGWQAIVRTTVVRDLLPIIDMFERAMTDTKQFEGSPETLKDGLLLIKKEFNKFLQKQGIKEISEVAVFNPELHEAIVQVDSDTHESGAVVEVLEKGYVLDETVIRPAKVSVAK